jgi:hypothetical protein
VTIRTKVLHDESKKEENSEGGNEKNSVVVRFSAPVRTCPGAHRASYTMSTGPLSWE